MLQSAPPHLRHFIVHLENTMWCTSTPKDRRSLHGCRRCLGKELLLPSMALIGSARNGNQDLVLSLSTKAKKMLRNMRTRSCYQCPYAQRQRVGDITVGDYWGVQKYDPQLLVEQGGTINSKEGVSCLLINTECGQHLVEKYGAKIESYPVEFSNIAQENTQLNRPTKHTRLRNKIFRKYKASGYAGVEAIFERDQRNQKFIWGMYDRICGMFCRKTR